MPYIAQEKREVFGEYLYGIGNNINSPGDLNYCFTVLMKLYLKKFGKSYTSLNDCVGICESAKLEFYRREVEPYENIKIDINGDVQI